MQTEYPLRAGLLSPSHLSGRARPRWAVLFYTERLRDRLGSRDGGCGDAFDHIRPWCYHRAASVRSQSFCRRHGLGHQFAYHHRYVLRVEADGTNDSRTVDDHIGGPEGDVPGVS